MSPWQRTTPARHGFGSRTRMCQKEARHFPRCRPLRRNGSFADDRKKHSSTSAIASGAKGTLKFCVSATQRTTTWPDASCRLGVKRGGVLQRGNGCSAYARISLRLGYVMPAPFSLAILAKLCGAGKQMPCWLSRQLPPWRGGAAHYPCTLQGP